MEKLRDKTKTSKTIQQDGTLASASSYREFVNIFLKNGARQGGEISFAEFARRCGFKSRSFPRDIVLGRRRMTRKTFDQFLEGMNLDRHHKNLFELLVAKEEPEIFVSYRGRDCSAMIQTLANKIKSRQIESNVKHDGPIATELRDLRFINQIFAAMTVDPKGSSVEAIHSKTGIPRKEILRHQTVMHRHNLVEEVDAKESVFCLDSRFFDFTTSTNNREFVGHMQNALQHASRAVTNLRADDQSNFFANSSFSLKRDDLPRMRAKLSELMRDFIVEHESDGNDVVNLTVCMFPELLAWGTPATSIATSNFSSASSSYDYSNPNAGDQH